jgi:hypothetical protein
MRILFFVILSFLFAHHATALSDVFLDDPSRDSAYNLQFVFDESEHTIFPEKITVPSYSIVRTIYTPTNVLAKEFLGVVVGPNNKIYHRFDIPLPTGVLTGAKVPFTVLAPYYPSAEKIDVYSGANMLFSIDVSASSICVIDGLCNEEAGEQELNCPNDCTFVPPPPPPPPVLEPEEDLGEGTLPPEGNIPTEGLMEETGGRFSPKLIALTFIVLGLLSFSVWMYLHKKAQQ